MDAQNSRNTLPRKTSADGGKNGQKDRSYPRMLLSKGNLSHPLEASRRDSLDLSGVSSVVLVEWRALRRQALELDVALHRPGAASAPAPPERLLSAYPTPAV